MSRHMIFNPPTDILSNAAKTQRSGRFPLMAEPLSWVAQLKRTEEVKRQEGIGHRFDRLLLPS